MAEESDLAYMLQVYCMPRKDRLHVDLHRAIGETPEEIIQKFEDACSLAWVTITPWADCPGARMVDIGKWVVYVGRSYAYIAFKFVTPLKCRFGMEYNRIRRMILSTPSDKDEEEWGDLDADILRKCPKLTPEKMRTNLREDYILYEYMERLHRLGECAGKTWVCEHCINPVDRAKRLREAYIEAQCSTPQSPSRTSGTTDSSARTPAD